MNNEVVLGIGSNIDPEKNHQSVIKELEKYFLIIRCSTIIKTKPIGIIDQPYFLNRSILIKTALNQNEVKKILINIENIMGRDRTLPKFGPRKIDIDIIIWGGEIVDNDFHKRDFLKKSVKELFNNNNHHK